MLRAVELAGSHPTHPNPRVGAVVVADCGEVVGEGYHLGPGHDHAEVVALREAGTRAIGASVYVTLEPCSFTGRTPPCVEALIEAGVGRVYVGVEDPDQRVSGSGIAALIAGGVGVEVWSDTGSAEAVDPAYFHHRRTGLPLVTVKYAMTLDGSVAASDGSSQWITGPEARSDAHRLRSECDAVVVGAGTLRQDDPRLDVRLKGFRGYQPRAVILAGSRELPGDRVIWERDPLVVSTVERSIPSGELIVVPGASLPDPTETARALADRGLLALLVEGGPVVMASWWTAGIVSRGVVYVGHRVGGGAGRPPMAGIFETIAHASDVEVTDVRMVGPDVRIVFS